MPVADIGQVGKEVQLHFAELDLVHSVWRKSRQASAELVESVEGAEDPAWAAAWSSELDRRLTFAERTASYGRSWDEVKADLLSDLASR